MAANSNARSQKAAKTRANRHKGTSLHALNTQQARLLEAVSDRILPTTETPGAIEAEAVIYIDRALGGAYRSLLVQYRRGLEEIDRRAKINYGKSFLELSGSEQDSILMEFEAGQVQGFHRSAQFFRLIRRHVLEGVFGEPSYGGNRDLIGWRLVGFPGQRYGYRDAYINRVVDLPPVAADGPLKPED